MPRPRSSLHRELLQSSLRAWVGMVQRHPRTTLFVASCVALFCLAYAVVGLGFRTDRTDLVHPSKAYYQNWQRYRMEFGGEEDILVVVEGTDRRMMVAAVETIARDIRAYPDDLERICYRVEHESLRSKGLYQLAPADLQQIKAHVDRLAPVLTGGWGLMTLDRALQFARMELPKNSNAVGLDRTGRENIESNARLIESMSQYLENDRIYQSPWSQLVGAQAQRLDNPWSQYFFNDEGTVLLLRVQPTDNHQDFNRFGRPLAIMRQVIAQTERAFPGLTIGLTGLPVLEYDEMKAAKSASTISLLLSIVGVSLLFIIAFRALRHPMFGLATLLIGGCWTLGWITWTVGHLSVLSVSFIVTLIGLGIDFSILWLSHYEAARTSGGAANDANIEAAVIVGPGIVIGGVTTALAFFTTMLTDFLGLRELGWIAGCGVLICLFITVTVLPALLALAGRAPLNRMRGQWDDLPALPWIARRPVVIAAAVAAVAAVVGLQIPRLTFDYNLLNLQARGLASVELEKRLIDKMGTSAWYVLSMVDSAESARVRKQQFEASDEVGRVVEIASLIPEQQEEKTPVIAEIHRALARLPADGHEPKLAPPALQLLRAELDACAEASFSGNRRDRALVERLQYAAKRARNNFDRLDVIEQQRRLASFQNLWIGDLLHRLRELAMVSHPEPITVADLPASLAERYYSPSGKWLLQIFAKSSVWDFEPLSRFRDAVTAVDPNATGKPINTLHALSEMNAGYRRSAVLAIVVIFLVVWLDMRRLSDTLLAMAPLLLGCAIMFGTMGMFGIALNPANMIAVPLILGIGIDFGVHVLHDFRRQQGRYQLNWRLARALVLTSLTTIIGFASLMTAHHWGMASIGLVLAIGVAACSLAVLLFLPAVLYLTTRRRPVRVSTVLGEHLPSTVTHHAA